MKEGLIESCARCMMRCPRRSRPTLGIDLAIRQCYLQPAELTTLVGKRSENPPCKILDPWNLSWSFVVVNIFGISPRWWACVHEKHVSRDTERIHGPMRQFSTHVSCMKTVIPIRVDAGAAMNAGKSRVLIPNGFLMMPALSSLKAASCCCMSWPG